jgi:hypothetical protein
MKIATSELIGPALDWAVAKIENAGWAVYEECLQRGVDPGPRPSEYLRDYEFGEDFSPSTNGSQGVPIIDREKIDFRWTSTGLVCVATISRPHEVDPHLHRKVYGKGPTMLIAAMRCYVAWKLGNEVDVPEGLA